MILICIWHCYVWDKFRAKNSCELSSIWVYDVVNSCKCFNYHLINHINFGLLYITIKCVFKQTMVFLSPKTGVSNYLNNFETICKFSEN